MISSLTFFSDKILTIRHQLDTSPVTDAPDFAIVDDAIIASAFGQFFPTSEEEELSGIVKKLPPNLVLFNPYLLLFCATLLMIYHLLSNKKSCKPLIRLSSMASSMKKAMFSRLLKKPSLDSEIFLNFRPVSNMKFSFCLRPRPHEDDCKRKR